MQSDSTLKTEEVDNNMFGTETINAIEEGRRIALDPTIDGYSNIEDLKKALEV